MLKQNVFEFFLGDDFLNNTLNGLVEFVAYFIVIVTMDRVGRKPLLSGCLILGGLACLASTVVNEYKGDDRGKSPKYECLV